MGKAIFLGLLLVLATVIAMTTSFVHPPGVAQSVVDKISPAISKDKESSSSEESSGDDYDKNDDSSESADDKEQMLCNVIVQATYDLHVHQSKSADEIIMYLDTDCKNLGTEAFIEECREMVAEHGTKIYEHVTNGMEMSQICKKIEDHNEMDLDDQRTAECSHKGGNKCQCCKMHVEKRKMRLRYIVKQMAKKRMCMCKKSPRPQRCRQWIRRKEQRALKRIEKICPRAICQHLGYCTGVAEDNVASKLLTKSDIGTVVDSPSLWLGLLDRQLEAHFTKNVCSEFEQLQALCIQLAASIDSRHYAKVYMAMLHNDTTWIDNGIREEVQKSPSAGDNVDLCGACKNVVQSSTTFYQQILETIRSTFVNTCEQCPVKETCQEFFNKRLDAISVYLHSLKPDRFCSAVHLCSSSSFTVLSPVNDGEKCAICVQRLQPRKDAAIQAISRLSTYFTDLCAKSSVSVPQCQQFVSEVVAEAHSFIGDSDVQEACLAMGFCGQNAAHDIDDYEVAFVEEIGKQVCSTLGPFETLCQQVVQGDSSQVQLVSLNATNIDDFFQHCEEEADEQNTILETTDQCAQNKDKCQCCIDRVIRKKKCFKKRVAKYVSHMLHLCKRCPAQEKCERYWEEKKACWNAKIDKICPKKVCVRRGYCTKVEMLSMCTYMGPFKEICEQALNSIEQTFAEGHKQAFAPLVGQMSVQPKEENKKQSVTNKL